MKRLGLLFVFYFAICECAFAWSFPFTRSHKSRVTISEGSHYRVLFYFTGSSETRKDERGKKHQWVEMNYKLVHTGESLEDLFGPSGIGEVRFLDKEGFVVIRDVVSASELLKESEYYAILWIPKRNAKQIQSGGFKSIPPKRLTRVVRKSKKEAEIYKKAIPASYVGKTDFESSAEIESEPYPFPSPAKNETETENIQGESSDQETPTVHERIHAEKDRPPTEEEMRVEMEKKLEGEESRITNEEVDDVIKQLDDQKPTEIEFPGTLQ